MTEQHSDIKAKIIEHLEGLEGIEEKHGSDDLIKTLSKRYDVPENRVQKILAEWSAGKQA